MVRHSLLTKIGLASALVLLVTVASPLPSPKVHADEYIGSSPMIVNKNKIANRIAGWRDCVGWVKIPHAASVTCSNDSGLVKTITTSLSGGINIMNIADLNAAVGYSVTHSTSIGRAYTITAPAHSHGKIQWRPIFDKRYKVKEVWKTCWRSETSGVYCNRSDPRYVITEHFDMVQFRVVMHR